MSGNRRKAFLVSAVLVGGAMLMTACQDANSDAGQSTSSASATGTAATPSGSSAADSNSSTTTGGTQGGGKDSTGKGSDGQGTTAGAGSKDSGKVGKCRTDELKITATDNTIAGDPDGTVAVQLKNGGGRDCAMSGYAGVDLKTNAGSLSARRTGQQATSITSRAGSRWLSASTTRSTSRGAPASASRRCW